MKRRLITLTISGSLLFVLCVAGIYLIAVAGWLLIAPEAKTQVRQSTSTMPQVTPVTFVIEEEVSPPELVAAALEQPAASFPTQPTAMPSPTATPTPTATPRPTPAPAGVATRLVIPKLNLDETILLAYIQDKTWQVAHLRQQIGHLEGTAAPGSDSNLVLAGHVTLEDGSSGPFAQLDKLARGDVVTVFEGDKAFHYIIDRLEIVDRSSVEVVYPSETGQITLITCHNWDSEARWYSDRLVVKGHLIQS